MKIEHVALYVNNLEEARNFFVRYLGAKSNDGYHNQKTGFRSYFLSFEDGARLELMNKPELVGARPLHLADARPFGRLKASLGLSLLRKREMPDLPKEPARTGYAHIAFSVGSREKVDALTAQLKSDGYEVVSGPRTTGDGYYESCILAMEGNQIEITV